MKYFKEILPYEFYQDNNIEYLIAVSIPKKFCSDVLKIICKYFILKNFDHLKRVRKIGDGNPQILLCQCENIEQIYDECITLIITQLGNGGQPPWGSEQPPGGLAEDEIWPPPYIKVSVPQFAPVTDEQFADSTKIWPVNRRRHSWNRIELTEAEEDTLLERLEDVIEEGKRSVDENNSSGTCCAIYLNDEEIGRGTSSSSNPLHHSSITAIKSVSSVNNYLCSNMMAVISHEPCVMCAMALLHSRFRAVVYNKSDIIFGGLGGKYCLHTNKKLTHKFNVLQRI
eukprot:GHVL01001495.1.p1 GENE.GHVL01001495.1~~GHVL01001495.1.p1  ORF type:complete len:284 (+),score=74.91 GHVL01001495.1:47-898(+)